MASENEEKYGAVAGTVVTEVQKGVTDTVDGVKQTAGMAQKVGGYLKRDIGNAFEWLSLSAEEKAARKAEEQKKAKEEQEEADRKKAEEAEAAAAEEQRLKDLKKSYIVHTAAIKCSYALHESYVVVPKGHGEFIHGIPQLNVGDSKPEVNIRSFGICNSPDNPSVKEAAEKIANEIKNRPKSFTEKVMDLFSKKPAKEVGADLLKQCVGVCTPKIYTEWIDGKEDVLIEGKPALLGKCKLTCSFNGDITLFSSGQRE